MDRNINSHPQPESHRLNVSSSETSANSRAKYTNILKDQLLPIANIGRIMKQVLPPCAKISKEAKETIQECASEFISFITGEASLRCSKQKRKTINGDDLYSTMKALGLDEYADASLRYLHKYKEYVEEANPIKRDKTIQIDITDQLSVIGNPQNKGARKN